jgi:hypothetical protein
MMLRPVQQLGWGDRPRLSCPRCYRTHQQIEHCARICWPTPPAGDDFATLAIRYADVSECDDLTR